MAAAWEAVAPGYMVMQRVETRENLRALLHEVDPHGLYRADPKTVNSVTPADDE